MLREYGDGERVPCTWCGDPLAYESVTVDRLVPGGSYEWANVVPACAPCNKARGDGRTAFGKKVARKARAIRAARTRASRRRVA